MSADSPTPTKEELARWREAHAIYGTIVDDPDSYGAVVGRLLDAVAVLTEERDRANARAAKWAEQVQTAAQRNIDQSREWEARVAVLEAGLREAVEQFDADLAARKHYSVAAGDCVLRGRALLGGVPAAAPARWTQEEIDTANEEGRALSAELAAASDRCLTCGSTDRAVLGPLCAIFGRFGAEPDPWHGGEIPS